MDLRRGEVDCNCLTLAETQLGLKGSVEMSTFSRLLLLLFGASLADNETQGLSGPWQGPCARVISCPGWRLNSLPKVKVGVGRDGKWKKSRTNVRITPRCPKRCQPPKMFYPTVGIRPILHIFTFEVLFLSQGEFHGNSHSFNHCWVAWVEDDEIFVSEDGVVSNWMGISG